MKEKKVRIVDIARMAGVSPGTIDRVLHNRGRIAKDKKQRIEAIIEQMGYRPNMAARMLAKSCCFTIAVVAPSYEGESYWKQVCEGIRKASDEQNQYDLRVEFIHFDQYSRTSFDEAVADVEWSRYNGVVIATLFESRVVELSARLDELAIPYVYIDSPVEGQSDMAYFGVDAHASGYIAGKMLCRELQPESAIVVVHVKFRRSDISVQMRKREEGLMRYLAEEGHVRELCHFELDPQRGATCAADFERLVSRFDAPVGVLVLNSRVYELAEFLSSAECDWSDKLVVAGFEAIRPNIEAMQRGRVRFLISQRPELQGYNAVKALGNLFVGDVRPERVNYMPIDILIPENIAYYSNYKL